jgi:hypothetical protein
MRRRWLSERISLAEEHPLIHELRRRGLLGNSRHKRRAGEVTPALSYTYDRDLEAY